MTRPRSIALRWLVWGGLLVLTTAVLLHVRDQIEQSHIALVLLLVVLGGSMEGGRPLGFTLACASFAADRLLLPAAVRLALRPQAAGLGGARRLPPSRPE